MSKANVRSALRRIQVASLGSPMAVFRHPQDGYLELMYANTILTRRLLETASDDLVGVFTQADCARDRAALVETLRKGAYAAPAQITGQSQDAMVGGPHD